MKTLVTLLIMLAMVFFAATAEAQKNRYRKGRNTYKKASDKASKKAVNKAKSAAQKAARQNEKDERKVKDAIEEFPDLEKVEEDETQKPGEQTSSKAKGEWIEEEMDKLGVKKKVNRAKMKRVGIDALKSSEKEDKRYADELKKIGSDTKLTAAATEAHKTKLGEIWEKADKELKKKEVLDEEKFEEWKKDTAEKRIKSATDHWLEEQAKKTPTRKGKRRKKNDSDD